MGNLSLIMTLSFLVGFGYIGFRQRTTQDAAVNAAIANVNAVQLKLLAATGANIALDTLTRMANPTAGGGMSIGGSFTYNGVQTGSFSTSIQTHAQDASIGPSQVRVTNTVTVDTMHTTTYQLLQFPSFARFAYVSNNDNGIWFITGDTLRGPVHTNTYFSLSGTPAFMNQVSSGSVYQASPLVPYATSGPTTPYFAVPPQWNVGTLALPTDLSVQRTTAWDSVGGWGFDSTVFYIRLAPNGHVQTRHTAPLTAGANDTAYYDRGAPPANGVIYIGTHAVTGGTGYNVYVQGTLNGRLTIATQGNINITGDIKYNTDPRVNPASTDMLGLCAMNDCILRNNVNGSTSAADRTIMAHIMTLHNTTNSNANFYDADYANFISGTLHIFGELAENHRGAVGQNTSPRTGYLKDYNWDSRLQNFSPPSYPLLTVLQQLYYWE